MSWPKSLYLPLALGILLFFAYSVADAQSTQPAKAAASSEMPTDSMPAILSAPEGLIKLDVVVTDKTGKPVSGLTLKDFTLLDQGQVSKVVSFQPFDNVTTKPSPTVEVILVLDTLGVNSKLAAHEQQNIQTFLLQNGGKLANPVSVFKIANAGLFSVAQASADGNALAVELTRGKLRKVREFRGMQAESLLKLQSLGAITTIERQKPGRKVLIWIGPEWKLSELPFAGILPADEQPFDAVSWYYTLLREARIAIYSITKPDADNKHYADIHPDRTADEALADSLLHRDSKDDVSSVHQRNLENLERNALALQSGGRLLEKSDDLIAQINRCIAEESAFYTLSFNPPRTDHRYEYHQLMLKPLEPELVARTSGGYYNQSYYYDRPNPALRRVTVEQLEAVLTAAQGKSDGETAHQLAALQLTERMNSTLLESWKAKMRGAKATAALVCLADASAFLQLPAAEIPAEAAPDIASQKQMVARAANYLVKTVPKLPNLFAARTTSSYEEVEQDFALGQLSETPSRMASEKNAKSNAGNHALYLANTEKVTVLYRDGNEIIDPGNAKHKSKKPESSRLTTRGTFGPMAAIVIADAANPPSTLAWSHWERSASGSQAVFSFRVAADKRHYQVQYCCLAEGDGKQPFQRVSGYHGEIAIDASTGAVMRLAMQADLNPALPLIRSDILVEYGPVDIGGETYIFPVRSVSISRWRSIKILSEWDLGYRVFGPYSTSLNDIVFSDYHLFRSQARMVLDADPPSEQK